MTTEQPTRPARPPRPGPAFRRAALGLSGPAPAPGSVASGPSRRETLREALARIPDLDRDAVDAAPDPDPEPAPPAPGASTDDHTGETTDDSAERGLRSFASRLLNGPVPRDAEISTEVEVDGTDPPTDPPTVPPIVPAIDADGSSPVTDGPSAGAALADAHLDPADAELFSAVDHGTPGAAGRDDDAGIATSFAPVVGVASASTPALAGGAVSTVAAGTASTDAPDWLAEAAARRTEPKAPRSSRARVAARPPAPTWRRVAFGTALVVLITAIPVLGRTGYRLVTESTDGQFSSSVRSPTDPGYEEEVATTPTLLLMQKDDDGRPVATTVLSLSGANGGGAVFFVPLAAEVRTPAFGVDRVSRAFDVLEERPPDGRKQVTVQVAGILNVGIDNVVEVDDRGWAQLVEPVAPLTIVNPDPIEVGGVEVPSGEIELAAEDVGPYLAASRPGESSFNALIRHELVWTAWLDAVASSSRDDVVPGETGTGIGLFARSLAAGPVTFSVVPTTPDADDETLLRVNHNQLDPMVLAAVPNPAPATPGSRPRVRLLNGVSAEAIPSEIIQQVVQIGGSVAVIGNGPSFGREETTIVYANPTNRGYAELLQVALGAGTVRLDPEAEDSVSLTVILGRDVIDAASATTTTIDLGASPGGS